MTLSVNTVNVRFWPIADLTISLLRAVARRCPAHHGAWELRTFRRSLKPFVVWRVARGGYDAVSPKI